MNEDQKFIKGFNAGYLLAKHNKELSEKLQKGLQKSKNSLVQGFLNGKLELYKEEIKERTHLRPTKTQRDDKSKDLER